MDNTVVVALIGAFTACLFTPLMQFVLARANKKDEKNDKYAEWRKHVDICLDNDNKRIETIEESSKLTLKSLLAILGHMESGNHTGELQKRREELEHFLIER